MIMHKVYVCNNFVGHYPVGTAAIVVAHTELQAKVLLDWALQEHGLLEANKEREYHFEEIDLNKSHAIILCNGDY